MPLCLLETLPAFAGMIKLKHQKANGFAGSLCLQDDFITLFKDDFIALF
jgi:hypothetical protein